MSEQKDTGDMEEEKVWGTTTGEQGKQDMGETDKEEHHKHTLKIYWHLTHYVLIFKF